MDRCLTQRSLNCRSMQVVGTLSFELLLRSSHAEYLRSYADAPSRRDLYKMAFLWLSENSRGAKEGRIRNQPQADSGNYAKTWTGWESTRSQYFKGSSRASQISLSSTRHQDSWSPGSMEHGYHIHQTENWLCLSCCRYGLVQSTSALVSGLKQFRNGLLLGSLRGSNYQLWSAGYFQYRSGSTVHLARICKCSTQQGHIVQYGWPRASARQYFCRTPMEIGKI